MSFPLTGHALLALVVLSVALQLADLASTLLAFKAGARETNERLIWLQARIGRDAAIVVAKLAIVALILFAWQSRGLDYAWAQALLIGLAPVYARAIRDNWRLMP